MLGQIKFLHQTNKMKRTTLLNLFIVGFVFVFGVTACKKKPTGITHIPQGSRVGPGSTSGLETGTGGTFPSNLSPDTTTGSIPMAERGTIEGRPQDRERFAANTVYFELDSAAVKPSEQSKLEGVASYFKSNPAGDLLIEGHCDERGTEGYNLTLGDRRANALREYLVNLGVSPDRIHTVSFGEAKPAVVGTDESAYSKNRRGDFVFIEPAK